MSNFKQTLAHLSSSDNITQNSYSKEVKDHLEHTSFPIHINENNGELQMSLNKENLKTIADHNTVKFLSEDLTTSGFNVINDKNKLFVTLDSNVKEASTLRDICKSHELKYIKSENKHLEKYFTSEKKRFSLSTPKYIQQILSNKVVKLLTDKVKQMYHNDHHGFEHGVAKFAAIAIDKTMNIGWEAKMQLTEAFCHIHDTLKNQDYLKEQATEALYKVKDFLGINSKVDLTTGINPKVGVEFHLCKKSEKFYVEFKNKGEKDFDKLVHNSFRKIQMNIPDTKTTHNRIYFPVSERHIREVNATLKSNNISINKVKDKALRSILVKENPISNKRKSQIAV